ncbi:uncharacterized protein DDB_G0283357-like [Daktulosphaira vitifoliae]|uniref:uncharacterized protein DDB_G0283357-like n=1 Tax=Daktulosphaira vitifoliae TaxID=58002 RepID=UPI0021AB040C|nr:uncharacterized protein DDB_G0283357-like [Daktulosphaira vitifoliae]
MFGLSSENKIKKETLNKNKELVEDLSCSNHNLNSFNKTLKSSVPNSNSNHCINGLYISKNKRLEQLQSHLNKQSKLIHRKSPKLNCLVINDVIKENCKLIEKNCSEIKPYKPLNISITQSKFVSRDNLFQQKNITYKKNNFTLNNHNKYLKNVSCFTKNSCSLINKKKSSEIFTEADQKKNVSSFDFGKNESQSNFLNSTNFESLNPRTISLDETEQKINLINTNSLLEVKNNRQSKQIYIARNSLTCHSSILKNKKSFLSIKSDKKKSKKVTFCGISSIDHENNLSSLQDSSPVKKFKSIDETIESIDESNVKYNSSKGNLLINDAINNAKQNSNSASNLNNLDELSLPNMFEQEMNIYSNTSSVFSSSQSIITSFAQNLLLNQQSKDGSNNLNSKSSQMLSQNNLKVKVESPKNDLLNKFNNIFIKESNTNYNELSKLQYSSNMNNTKIVNTNTKDNFTQKSNDKKINRNRNILCKEKLKNIIYSQGDQTKNLDKLFTYLNAKY